MCNVLYYLMFSICELKVKCEMYGFDFEDVMWLSLKVIFYSYI